MLVAISEAERTVDLMTYVYWTGDIARAFADALSERARAGLRVRLLIDAVGGFKIEKGLVERMQRAGVNVQWFRKPWMKSPFKQNHRLSPQGTGRRRGGGIHRRRRYCQNGPVTHE